MNAGEGPFSIPFALRSVAGVSRRAMAARLLTVAWVPFAGAVAHEFTITPVTIVIAGDGTFQADVGLDADALALGLPLETESERVFQGVSELRGEALEAAIETARGSIQTDIGIAFDGVDASFEITFPHYGTPATAEADPPTVLGTLARLRGQVPESALEVAFRAPAQYKTVALQVLAPDSEEPSSAVLEPGEPSQGFPLSATARPRWSHGVFVAYLKLGFTHIVPKGLDHILFVLGLFLLSVRWRPLLYQVTAFTVAHSVTLALSMQGVVSLPERFVETLIALSISWVAIENIATSALKPWRVAVVFGFGLLHGLGFAGVLSELGMPEGRFLTALLAFNVGVELGQVGVVALAFGVLGRFRNLSGYRRFVVIPCSGAIAATGCWWSVSRAFG